MNKYSLIYCKHIDIYSLGVLFNYLLRGVLHNENGDKLDTFTFNLDILNDLNNIKDIFDQR